MLECGKLEHYAETKEQGQNLLLLYDKPQDKIIC